MKRVDSYILKRHFNKKQQCRNPGRSNLMKDDKEILNFLAITEVELKSQPDHIVSQMRTAVAKDDCMKLHHLGYEIQIGE